MDLFTIIGMIGGAVCLSIGIVLAGGNLVAYITHWPSWFITGGGTVATVLIGQPGQRIRSIIKIVRNVFFTPRMDEREIINTLVTFSEKARREGLLALEDDLEEVTDVFLRKGIQLVVDGTDPELVKHIMTADLDYMTSRHVAGQQIFDDMGTLSPAFGMIGTLIGLIAMMKNLEDKSGIAAGMGTALLTTLYGAVLANLFFIPIANKLRDRHSDESLMREIMVEGTLSIQAGDNPRIVKEKLVSFLPPRLRAELAEEEGEK